MKKEVCSVLYYLATVKIVDIVSKGSYRTPTCQCRSQ